ncbi:hypothetical protein ACFOWE_05210 [Planomonospora corallina]|uniref:Gram-positive cocci surface proteins LPxTG domain-containing protein n=1 Tax=Planomonospora corallina TaxID=1806052 RepID=A0ABV8I1E7_9ACTN
MLKSRTRRRVAVKTAAIGLVGAGVVFGAVPAIASMVAAPAQVTYNCTGTGTGTAAAASPYKLQLELTGPVAPTPSSTVVATWKINQPAAAPSLLAPSAVAATERLVVEGGALVTGSPLPTPSSTVYATASSTPGAIAANSPLPGATVLITMVPTATGVIGVQPGGFFLAVGPTSGTGTATDLYECVPATPAEVTAAQLLITVKPSGAGTGTGTGTGTPSPTATTPKPTITVYETVTGSATPTTKTSRTTKTRQIEETPEGPAATGGGGESGPDARMIMLSGALMVVAAGAGGLALRRRTVRRG